MGFLNDATMPSEAVSLMMAAATEGAREALRNRLKGLNAQAKSQADGDFVTQGDQASQLAIFRLLPPELVLDGATQAIGFFGEETMQDGYVFPPHARFRWCIDPVDGTKPYYNGESFWCVSAALQELNTASGRWESVAAVLYRATAEDTPDALCGAFYWAQKGRGTYRVDVRSQAQVRLAMPEIIAPEAECEMTPEVDTPAARAFAVQAHAMLTRNGIVFSWRRSICYAVCEMLEGQKAAVVQGVAGPFDWDIAAISLLAAEAGAHCSFAPAVLFPEGWRYPAIMAWDKPLYDALIAIAV